MASPAGLLRNLFDSALDAVSPQRALPPFLPEPPPGRTVLLAVGKAATAMADVAVANWRGPLTGLAVTRYGHVLPGFARHRNIELIEAGHPVPDANSVVAARRAVELARPLGRDDLALVLVSGGGSALWCLPIAQSSLEEKQRITRELLHAGATINELNTVRKALSQIKGGKLALAASPARVVTLIISDVVGDDPAMVASGPTIGQPDTSTDAAAILDHYRVEVRNAVLQAPGSSAPCERAHPRNAHHVIAAPGDALAAAGRAARAAGLDVRMLGDAIEGDARDAARTHAALAREAARASGSTVILSGGELTAAVRDPGGVGGPNTEFLLALALELDGADGIHAIACDTDGYDGCGSNAGAVIGPTSLARARDKGLDPVQALNGSNSARFFESLGDLVITGPTQTNVSDFRAVLVTR